ncbi:Xylose isomerase-like TIM barrel [Bythopirellula polymerisocia]|uniref:Xylose isomerase-like TIM barrel n=2 Tax=Bythopirellula polymerisocia TaxID=2528003 RepID=A0A5C6CD25_9BACT|nr:Xylose isomerase-like TIM barrel [Bythopirellula polymerisocia]
MDISRFSRTLTWFVVTLFAVGLIHSFSNASPAENEKSINFSPENLVAWCIVPFDAKHRSPAERAAMLNRLGLNRVAYDWRAEHVPTFEKEILEYKKHGIDFFAFWDWHPEMVELVKKHGIHPQFWVMMPNPETGTQEEKVEAAAKQLMPKVNEARQLGCQLGLYNHGGWAGEPLNLVAVCRWLRDHADAKHVGIVYNFHHAHEHIDDFADVFASLKSYLLCLNLNGMNRDANPKILPIGQGEFEKEMIEIVQHTGYDGPIGILDHREDTDSEVSLRENLDGLARLQNEIE